jgi:uncharacterized protein (DUF58 family)
MPKKDQNIPRPILTSHLLPALVIIVAFMQLVDPSKIWVSLLAGMGIYWLSAYLWSIWLTRSLSLKREMRFGWAQVGDTLEERFTLTNTSWLPASWVEISDLSDMPGYNTSQVRGVNSGSQSTWRSRGMCTRRGLFTLGPTTLLSGDPFGLYRVKIQLPASTNLLVMPPIVPLPAIEVAAGGRAGEGPPRRDAPERTVAASSVREFTPGDSLHLIHWKTTARRDSPYVRIFDGTPAGDWWVILDLEGQVQVGEGWETTEEHGVILAASLADQGLRLRKSVGLVVNSDPLAWLPPQLGEQRRFEILRSLALSKPGEIPLASLLERTKDWIVGRSSLVIITPNPSHDWIKAMVPLIWRGAVPTVLLLNASDWVSAQPGDERANQDGLSKEDLDRQTQSALNALAHMGVKRYLIPREIFDRPEARPGQEGQWEWRVTPRGRAVAVGKPVDAEWKILA